MHGKFYNIAPKSWLNGCLWLASIAALAPSARADFKDDIDFTKLKAEYGAALPDGSGVRLVQVEYIRDNSWAPQITGELAGKTVTYLSTYNSTVASSHAYEVAAYLLGGSRSMTPGLTSWKSSEAWAFSGRGNLNGGRAVAPIAATWDIENHSWGGTDIISGGNMLYKEDYRIERDNIIAVIGVDNGSSMSMLFGNCYNGISVGTATGGNPSTGTSADTVGRMKPDLVGTATWTSYTTPMVSSSAMILVGEINRSPTLVDARNPLVVKSLLMAGATKNQFPGWSHSPQRPLDSTFGAGQLNIYNSYKMLIAGKQAASGSSEVRLNGWDLNSTSTSSRKLYFFSVPAGKRMTLSAVMAWYRHVVPDALWNLTTRLENLDLVLWRTSGYQLGSQVTTSSSTIDNVEHLYETTLLAGQYAIEVKASTAGEKYGLAWKTTLVDDPTSVPPQNTTTTTPTDTTTTTPTDTTTTPTDTTTPTTTTPTDTTTTTPTTTTPTDTTTTTPTTTTPTDTTTTTPTTTTPTDTTTTTPTDTTTTTPTTTTPTDTTTTTPTTTTPTDTTTTTPTTTTPTDTTTTPPTTTTPTDTTTTTPTTTTPTDTTTTTPTDTTTTTPTTTPTDTTTTTPTTTPTTTTPSPFATQYSAADIGSVGVSGTTNYEPNSGIFSISGAGADIGGLADAFQFASAPISGDTQSVVKVESFAVANSSARAGLMIRENTNANSSFAGVFVSNTGAVQFVRRTMNGGYALVTAGQSFSFPIYLKITRTSNVFTACYSSNGSDWAALGSVEFSMLANARVGLAVSSKSTSQLGVLRAGVPTLGSIPATVGGLSLFDVGASNAAASATANGSQYSLTGCGYLLPGGARESLALLGKKNGTNLALATQVLPFRAGTPPSRAGLTIRESLLDNCRMVSLCIDNQGRVVFEYRSSPGAFAVSRTLTETARHILLDRQNNTFSAMVSNDGVTWRTVATATINFRATTYIGLMTVSSQTSTAVTADFDGFDVVAH